MLKSLVSFYICYQLKMCECISEAAENLNRNQITRSALDRIEEQEAEKLVKEMKVDGIETNYIYIDRNNTKHNDIDKWTKFANKLNLPTTIGSDFHNDDGIHPVIGLLNEDINLSNEDIDNILSFIERE